MEMSNSNMFPPSLPATLDLIPGNLSSSPPYHVLGFMLSTAPPALQQLIITVCDSIQALSRVMDGLLFPASC